MKPYPVRILAASDITPEVVLDIIARARRQEARTGAFLKQLHEKSATLPASIVFDGYQPSICLFQFAVEYIEMAPRLIECVGACAREAGKAGLFAPFITTAIRYFTQPSIVLAANEGLDGLLIRAYLCHRLMEEMYENNYSTRHSQLVDIEVTQANLLAHELIGEPFANELDAATVVTATQIAGTPDYYQLNLDPFVEQAKHAAWSWMRDYWEHLLIRNHIRLSLTGKY